MVALGVGLAYWAIERDFKRFKVMAPATFSTLFAWAIGFAILGGRFLYVLEKAHTFTSWRDIFFVWQGGLSVLGAVILIIAYAFFILRHLKIPYFPCLDIVAIYAPLMHAFGRLGCLWAGCCYGGTTNMPWAIMYGGNPSEAPVHIPLHPTQAYSALIFFVLFGILVWLSKKRQVTTLREGLLSCIYLFGMSSERFLVDFLRDDRSLWFQMLSLHQLFALLVGGLSVGVLVMSRKRTITT